MRRPRLLVGIVLSLCLLAALVWLVDLGIVLSVLSGAHWGAVGLSLLAVAGALLARTYRWSWLMREGGRFRPIADCLPIFLGSNTVNLIVPLRGGDVLRVFWFARRQQVPGALVAASITLEHVLASLAIVLCVVLLLVTVEVPAALVLASYGLGASAVAILVLAWIATGRPRRVERIRAWAGRLPGRPGAVAERIARDLFAALNVLRRPCPVLGSLAATVAVWALQITVVAAMLAALDFDLPWQAAVVVILANSIGLMLPTAPGNIGVAHAVAVSALAVFGVPFDEAFAFAILFHGVPHVFVILIGMAAIWYAGLPWREAVSGDTGTT